MLPMEMQSTIRSFLEETDHQSEDIEGMHRPALTTNRHDLVVKLTWAHPLEELPLQ